VHFRRIGKPEIGAGEREVFPTSSTRAMKSPVEGRLVLCKQRPEAHGSRRCGARVLHSGRPFHGFHKREERAGKPGHIAARREGI
jgi:hypothetical protein